MIKNGYISLRMYSTLVSDKEVKYFISFNLINRMNIIHFSDMLPVHINDKDDVYLFWPFQSSLNRG
jgi:hypothetical protein